MPGTGLPLPKSGEVLTSVTPVIDGDRFSSAQAWTSIAASAKQIASAGMDMLAHEVEQRKAKTVADFETDNASVYTKLRDQHAHDPTGFEKAAAAHNEGAISRVPSWMAAHAQKYLGGKMEGGMASILSEKRTRDTSLAAQSLDARLKQADNDVMTLATAGKVGTPDWEAAHTTYKGVLETAVSTGLMTTEKASLLAEDMNARSQGEFMGRDGIRIYREKGLDAAVDHLRKSILDNTELKTSTAKRYQIFNRAMSQVRLANAEDKQDRGAVVELSRDLRARISSQQPVDPAEVRDIALELRRTGAAAEHHRLIVAHAVAEGTAPYRTGLRLGDFAYSVSGARAATASQPAQTSMQFFMSRGYSKAAAAGIVGNLIQENATFNPAQSHDGGTGIGIAGWRLERRTALRQFASARGKTETDFQTQLEFIDHELNTTESGVKQRLVNAKTAPEAAEAFIHFERPAGYRPDNPRAGHGFANRVRNAAALGGGTPDAVESAALPHAGEITKGVQQVFVAQARKAWPDFKAKIDQGRILDDDDVNAIRYAAALSGDANWQQEVEARVVANQVGTQVQNAPAGQRLAALDQVRSDLQASGLPVIDQDSVSNSLQAQFERQNKQVREDPVGYAIERGQKPPAPLDLSSSDAARAAVAQRVSMVRGVAADQEVPAGSPFRPAERATIAAAVTSGKPAQAAVALDAIASLPDEMLVPALNAPEIKAAITGAIRSPDAGRYSAAMGFMDGIWSRAPETAKQLFGEEAIHGLMTWQANQRYMTPEQLAEDRKRTAQDPQLRERIKRNEQEGRELARKTGFDDVVKQFDSSWWITPGPVARALGSQPLAPVDAMTRDALMGDYETIYARRYAETLDPDKATEQTVALLKTKWMASPVNGGRLMLNAPETLRDRNGNPVYPAVQGSYDWMTRQIETDIGAAIGKPRSREAVAVEGAGGTPITTGQNWSWTIVADRQTQAEAQNGTPASYQVVVTDAESGRVSVLPQRYRWDATGVQTKARGDFAVERRRVLEAPYGAVNPGDDLGSGIVPPYRPG
jgi:hypothetical protein